MKSTFRLGAFIENIEGTVVNPNNALGSPDGVFTGNTTGSWTAKWALEAPEQPTAILRTAEHLLRIHCKRAVDTPTVDPIVWRATIRDGNNQEVFSFFQLGQLSRHFGAGSWVYPRSEKLVETLLTGTLSHTTSYYLRNVHLANNNKLVWHTSDRLNSLSGFNTETPQIDVVTSTVATQNTDNAYLTSNSDASIVVNWYAQAFLRKDVSGQFQYVLTTRAGALSNHRTNSAAFDDTNNFVAMALYRSSGESTRWMNLYSINWDTNELSDITVSAGLNTVETSNTLYNATAWKGNLLVFGGSAVVGGATINVWAYTWDSQAQTATIRSGFPYVVTGFSTTQINSLAISPDGSHIFFANGGQLAVIPVSNPANTKTLIRGEINFTHNPVWVSDSTVAFTANVHGPEHATPANVHGPRNPTGTRQSFFYVLGIKSNGDLVIESSVINKSPLSLPLFSSVSFSSDSVLGKVEYLQRNHTLGCFRVMDNLDLNPSRSKFVLEKSALFGTASFAQQSAYISKYHNYYGEFLAHTSRGGFTTQLPGHSTHTWSPCGRYFLREANQFSISSYWPRLFRSFTLETLLKNSIPEAESTNINVSHTGQRYSFSHDGNYLTLGYNAIVAVHDTTPPTFTNITPSWLSGTNNHQTVGAWRPAPNPADPHPHICLYGKSTGTPTYRCAEIVDGVFVDKSADYVFPNLVAGDMLFVHWSHDGEYVWLGGERNTGNIYSWNNGVPQKLNTSTPIASSTADHVIQVRWHPTENIIFLLMSRISTAFGSPGYYFKFYSVTGNVLTELNASGTKTVMDAVGVVTNMEWLGADGAYLAFRVASILDGQAVSFANAGVALNVLKWDVNKLTTGLDVVASPLGVNGYGITGRPDGLNQTGNTGAKHVSHGYESLDGRMLIGVPVNSPTEVIYGGPNMVDYGSLQYDENWSIELEVFGDAENTVQLEGIELELDLLQFQLAAPTNLQVISATGSSALVQWEWSSE